MKKTGQEKVEKKKVKKLIKDPHSWTRKWSAETKIPIDDLGSISREYMEHLAVATTERESVRYWIDALKRSGFKDLSRCRKIKAGDGFFIANREKAIAVGIAGSNDIEEGMNIIVSHLDSPRLDLKPVPLAGDSDTGLGLLRTHYYGGIKKYHWVNIPLALKGCVIKENGERIDIDIGMDENDPVFTVPDLLPHLSRKTQNARKLSMGIRGEDLQALSSSGPVTEEDNAIVEHVLEHLKGEYGIEEEDLVSSELCLVPAWKPREIGLDRGLIGAYGHDNRVSSYASNRALMDLKKKRGNTDRWCVSFCFDKEEIGSDGPSGAKSAFVELTIYKLMEMTGRRGTGKELRRTMSSSFVLSADVKSGINPNFKGLQDPNNSARLGAGLTITKYTGRGGKVGANDASAEMVSSIRKIYNDNGIIWQMQETGKVDMGGGGTVAKFMATRNMDVIDTGIPLLSMHSPFEVLAKVDLFMAVKGFTAFYKEMGS